MPRNTPDGIHSRRMLNCEEFKDQAIGVDVLYEFPDDLGEDC